MFYLIYSAPLRAEVSHRNDYKVVLRALETSTGENIELHSKNQEGKNVKLSFLRLIGHGNLYKLGRM